MSILLPSLLDPVLWAVVWSTVWCSYRLPKWSWLRLPIALLSVGSMAGILVLQAYWWESLAPPGADHRIFDRVFFPEMIPVLPLLFYAIFREERAKNRGKLRSLTHDDLRVTDQT